MMFFLKVLFFQLLLFSETVHHKVDVTVKNCPEKIDEIVKEILQLELAGERWVFAKDQCFKNLKQKYVYTAKSSNGAESVFKVKDIKLLAVKYLKERLIYRIDFEATNAEGETKKASIEFTAETLGEPIPPMSCALATLQPSVAFVSEKCFK